MENRRMTHTCRKAVDRPNLDERTFLAVASRIFQTGGMHKAGHLGEHGYGQTPESVGRHVADIIRTGVGGINLIN